MAAADVQPSRSSSASSVIAPPPELAPPEPAAVGLQEKLQALEADLNAAKQHIGELHITVRRRAGGGVPYWMWRPVI